MFRSNDLCFSPAFLSVQLIGFIKSAYDLTTSEVLKVQFYHRGKGGKKESHREFINQYFYFQTVVPSLNDIDVYEIDFLILIHEIHQSGQYFYFHNHRQTLGPLFNLLSIVTGKQAINRIEKKQQPMLKVLRS